MDWPVATRCRVVFDGNVYYPPGRGQHDADDLGLDIELDADGVATIFVDGRNFIS